MSVYVPGGGLPPALPLGSTHSDASPQVRAGSGVLRGTNIPETSSPELPTKRLRRVDLDVLLRIQEAMPPRDREVLERVGEHRYLTTNQVQRFVFTDHSSDESAARTTRHVLHRLSKLALLRSLQQRIGGYRAGSSARVWQLSPAGARLLHDDGVNHRVHEPSPRFLSHCLAVADVHLGIRDLTRLDHVRDVSVETEPTTWRRYAGTGGELRWLQPDIGAVVTTSDYTDRWLLEVDLGTESLPTLLRKCGQYEAYRATGIEQDQHGAFPLVIWTFTKPERAERLQDAIARSPRLTPQLYRFATVESFTTVAQERLT